MTHEALIDANEGNEETPEPRKEVKGYGRYLQQAREALGFSIDEVAIELHLARDIIVHLEQEMLAALPDPIFVRGYIRAYAKLVQADPDQAIAAFNEVCAPVEPKKLNLGKHIVIKEMRTEGEKPVRWGTYIIFIGIAVLLLMWWHSHGSQNNTSSDSGTMAALANLKPVVDSNVSTALPTTAVTSISNATSPGTIGAAAAMPAAAPVNGTTTTLPATATTPAANQSPIVNSPQAVVNTNVQNLAPSTGATATAVSSTTANTGTANVVTSQPGQTLANTPTPVVGATPATSNVKPSKSKGAASAWRNPDLE